MGLRIKAKNYVFVLIAQLILLLFAAFMQDFLILYLFFALAMLGIFGSVIASIWESLIPRALAIITGAIAFISGFVWAVPNVSRPVVMISIAICAFAYAAFVLIAIISIGRSVFTAEHDTKNSIMGSLCIYMLIGMFFAFFYAGLDVMRPDAINFSGANVQDLGDFSDYLYFSYTTLTTTGFGDIVPVRPVARLLAYMETVIGSMYLVIVVASLVSIHISQLVRRQISKVG
ncbi:MAG: potassium channel family protein [Pseudomonadota bacterium]